MFELQKIVLLFIFDFKLFFFVYLFQKFVSWTALHCRLVGTTAPQVLFNNLVKQPS